MTGRLAHTFDLRCLSKTQIQESFARLSSGSELVVVEAQSAVFDSYEENFSAKSVAEISQNLGISVVLVLDASEEKINSEETNRFIS